MAYYGAVRLYSPIYYYPGADLLLINSRADQALDQDLDHEKCPLREHIIKTKVWIVSILNFLIR